MKNPWMSMWLSAANSVAGPIRNRMMAEFSKTQRAMLQEWQRAWMDAWMSSWQGALIPVEAKPRKKR